MSEPMNCPECGEPCDRDEVDIGVGVQYGPWGCYNCGWSEGSMYSHPEPDSGLDPLGGWTPPSKGTLK